MTKTVWTDETTALLKRLWCDGLSCSQIARKIPGTTRNAVIGKVHRLGLNNVARNESAAPRSAAPLKRVVAKAARAKPLSPSPEHGWRTPGEGRPPKFLKAPPPPVDIATRPQLCDLQGLCVCRWPLLDLPEAGNASEQRFCGVPVKENLSQRPYCASHLSAARSGSQPDPRSLARLCGIAA